MTETAPGRHHALVLCLERISSEISDNNTDGARMLYLQAISIVQEYLKACGTDELVTENTDTLATALENAKPSMAPLLNLAWEVRDVVERKGASSLPFVLERLHIDAQRAGERLARNFKQALWEFVEERNLMRVRITTLSSSSAVKNGLVEALSAGARISLTVAESRTVCDGTMMAMELAGIAKSLGISEDDFDITLVTDATLPGCVENADLALVGCDALLPDAFVNKTGTLSLALAARYYDVPLQMVTENFKSLTGEAVKKLKFPDEEPGELLRGVSSSLPFK